MKPHTFEMEFNSVSDEVSGFVERLTYRDAPWEVGHVSPNARRTPFKHDRVFHRFTFA